MPSSPDSVSQHTVSSNGGITGSGRSVYPKGPGFSLNTFSSKEFVVKDFIESLSEGAASKRSDTQAFDPKPYIRAFEHALQRLDTLSEERESHEHELAEAVRRVEAQHRQHCAVLQGKLDQALESFNLLDNRIDTAAASSINGNSSEVEGSSALQIGGRLEELDRQKRRAEDAKFLLSCWQAASERGDLSQLEDIRRLGGGEGKVRCAQLARQLLKISNRLAPDNTSARSTVVKGGGDRNGYFSGINGWQSSETIELIEKFLERLETDLLEQFDECRRQHFDDGMRECAAALYDFGDGASVIGRFVAQHELFLERSHMMTDEVGGDRETWEKLADPDSDPLGVEPSLQALIDEVKLVVKEESFAIKKIFPFHELVLSTFLQRVFQQLIQQRLEMVLEKAGTISQLAFLRTLQAARSYIGAMVDDLKLHGLTEHPETASPQATATLDQQLEDLFVPYFVGSSYIEGEKRSLEELYASLLFKYTLFHSKKRKSPTTYLGSLSQRGMQLLSSARDAYMDRLDSSDLTHLQKVRLMSLAGLGDTENKNRADIEVTETDGVLSLQVAKRMFKWLAEAVGRGLELSNVNDTPKDVSALQRLLISHVGEIYLDTALDSAIEAASLQENSKTEPDLAFVGEVRVAISILQLTMTIVHTVLLPLAVSNVTVRRDMEKSINAVVGRIEDKISIIRSRIIDIALNWVSKLMARQNRTDFRPRDDAPGIEQLQTPTCSSIFTFMVRIRDLSSAKIDGKNQEPFFTELALGFRSLLLDHFKKFQVNLAGGLMVSKDITKYIELLRTLPLATSFQPSLEVLMEIGNIFVIGPEALKDRLRGGIALTGTDKADLRPYILRREDANSVGVQAVLNAL